MQISWACNLQKNLFRVKIKILCKGTKSQKTNDHHLTMHLYRECNKLLSEALYGSFDCYVAQLVGKNPSTMLASCSRRNGRIGMSSCRSSWPQVASWMDEHLRQRIQLTVTIHKMAQKNGASFLRWCQIPQAELTYCQRSKLIRYHWKGTLRSLPLVSKTLPNTTLNAWICQCNQGAIGILRVWRSIFTTSPSCERWWN